MNEKEKKAIERCNQLRQVEHANWIGISNQLAIITVLNLIEKQQAEIEKKDKIIDLMAEYLASIDFDEHCVEVPGICIGCPKEDDLDGYMQCIKQYFERKIEKGE